MIQAQLEAREAGVGGGRRGSREGPIYESAEAARNAGSRALMTILARFGKKTKKPKK
jgi:hypothetical protein